MLGSEIHRQLLNRDHIGYPSVFNVIQKNRHEDLSSLPQLHEKYVQSNSVITNSPRPAIFVRYNRVNLCTKMAKFP